MCSHHSGGWEVHDQGSVRIGVCQGLLSASKLVPGCHTYAPGGQMYFYMAEGKEGTKEPKLIYKA